MCYFCHAQLFEITYAENIKSPFVQHSCRNAKVVEVFRDAGCRLSTRCRPSIHGPPVDALRVPAEMPIALSWVPLHADIHVVLCCGRAHHREQHRHAIPIALAASHCPTARDFVPWRFLVAGSLSVRSVSLWPASKNLHTRGLMHCNKSLVQPLPPAREADSLEVELPLGRAESPSERIGSVDAGGAAIIPKN